MDTSRAARKDVSAEVAEIKACMPETYKAIKRAAEIVGNDVYRYVRKGLQGADGCFYAIENGMVKGVPIRAPEIHGTVAALMVQFGFSLVIMWNEEVANKLREHDLELQRQAESALKAMMEPQHGTH